MSFTHTPSGRNYRSAISSKHASSKIIRGGASKDDNPAKSPTPSSPLLRVLFPIYPGETKKFLLIGGIKFFVIFALTLTRDNKDTMVVTECGAEAIAFLKVSACGKTMREKYTA